MDEVNKMENSMMIKEQEFARKRAMTNQPESQLPPAVKQGGRDLERAWAEERAEKVAQVKNERERLERERTQILDRLDTIK